MKCSYKIARHASTWFLFSCQVSRSMNLQLKIVNAQSHVVMSLCHPICHRSKETILDFLNKIAESLYFCKQVRIPGYVKKRTAIETRMRNAEQSHTKSPGQVVVLCAIYIERLLQRVDILLVIRRCIQYIWRFVMFCQLPHYSSLYSTHLACKIWLFHLQCYPMLGLQTDTVLTTGNWRSLVTAGMLIASKAGDSVSQTYRSQKCKAYLAKPILTIFNQRTRQRTRKLWGRMWCWKKFHYNYIQLLAWYIIILCFWWPATFSMLAFCKSLHRWSMLKHPEVWEDIHPWICPACQDMPRHLFLHCHIFSMFLYSCSYYHIIYDMILVW